MKLRTALVFGLILLCSAVYAGKTKPAYVPLDYSFCGYRASEQPLPVVQNVVKVRPQKGDCSLLLQQAIDFLAKKKPDKSGHRGAILLLEGVYEISQPLRIAASGIVLRGESKDKTILRKTSYRREPVIVVEGSPSETARDTVFLTSELVRAGAMEVHLSKADGSLQAGDEIALQRPSTKEWIEHLACNDFGGGLDYTGWKPTDTDLTFHRRIASIEGGKITLDAPLTCSLNDYGRAFLQKVPVNGSVKECGVENLTVISNTNDWNSKDEDHAWDGVYLNFAEDCWVRRCRFSHLSGSAVNVQRCRRITVEDCIAEEPVSEIGEFRRTVFLTRGEQVLFQRCISREGIHDFAADYTAAGPNAFVQCEAEGSLGFSGSVGSWATGLLFDIVNIEGGDISLRNLEQFRCGTGWNTANSMVWQSTASTIYCYSPDSLNQNSVHGCWATMTGNGYWSSSNSHVTPRSLFYDQLLHRMGKEAALNGYILPRNTVASSSPEIEAAQRLAQETLLKPRLTMEMWLDSVPYNAPLNEAEVKEFLSPKAANAAFEGDKALCKDRKKQAGNAACFAIKHGKLLYKDAIIEGVKYQVPWWTGRIKDNFVAQKAKPAITRYVPGRYGLGWTDSPDSVVCYMQRENIAALDHNYGLWYDLRRTDHERIKRMDGGVWAPFYEQPFSRSGKGKAWDGLSLYDLGKPNLWYFTRLKEFAKKASVQGKMLFQEHFFQHNIIEAGAHWVDCPWRPVNNINATDFPEPVPFTGDKRIFMAEQFYDTANKPLNDLQRGYIRMCLDNLRGADNVVHLISEEFTGPEKFVRLWLETIREWQKETGEHPLIALAATKDVQDKILADSDLAQVVDIIDIRYWHYKTDGIFAPEGGKNLAPRQFMRRIRVGKSGFNEVYRAVREYTAKYPEKAVLYFGQSTREQPWAAFMAGGSMTAINVRDASFALKAAQMRPIDTLLAKEDGVAMGCGTDGNGGKKPFADAGTDKTKRCDRSFVVYSFKNEAININIPSGKYAIKQINTQSGEVKVLRKSATSVANSLTINAKASCVYWIE